MKKAGIIILIVGLAVTLVTGLDFVTREKVVDIGELEISTKRKHSLSWSPIVGVIVIAVGAGFFPPWKQKITEKLKRLIKNLLSAHESDTAIPGCFRPATCEKQKR